MLADWIKPTIAGKIVSSPRSWKSLRLPTNFHDTSNLLDTSMVWKFVGSQLPTFWTLPWYGNLLEVNFQPFGHFHGMEICWKSTSNLLDTSMVWNFFGSIMEICWKSKFLSSGEDTIFPVN